MRNRRGLLLLLLLIAGAWIGLLVVGRAVERRLNGRGLDAQGIAALPDSQASPGTLPVLWQVPSFQDRDQDGRPFSDADLRGKVWIADFIFAQCTSACPMLTAKMRLLQRQAPQSDVHFLSFSVDPEHDTPAVLKQYAKEWHGDLSRWTLLSGDAGQLARTTEGMKVSVRATSDRDNPIVHSDLFMLIDRQGCVRGVYDSGDDIRVNQLAADARMLAGDASPAPSVPVPTDSQHRSPAAEGELLFANLGCATCHNQARVAPTLAGVSESMVKLEDGTSVRADERYLRESIVDPNAKIVAGYNRLMPSYAGSLTDAQIDSLISYIQMLPPPSGRTASASPSAIDPVCEMRVQAGDDTPHVSYAGKTFYFCSDRCKHEFEKHLGQYVSH